jgi:hypothetical protein
MFLSLLFLDSWNRVVSFRSYCGDDVEPSRQYGLHFTRFKVVSDFSDPEAGGPIIIVIAEFPRRPCRRDSSRISWVYHFDPVQ